MLAFWITAALAALAQASPSPAPAPVKETFNKNREILQGILDRVVDASKSEEFLVWYDGQPLASKPKLMYSEEAGGAYYDCTRLMGFEGGAMTAATDCDGSLAVAAGRKIAGLAIDEAAFTLAHETAHLLLRHMKGKNDFCEKTWVKAWLRTEEGRRWRQDPLRSEKGDSLERRCRKSLEFKELELKNGADADHWALKIMEIAKFDVAAAHAYLKKRGAEMPPEEYEFIHHYSWDIRSNLLKSLESGPWAPPAEKAP